MHKKFQLQAKACMTLTSNAEQKGNRNIVSFYIHKVYKQTNLLRIVKSQMLIHLQRRSNWNGEQKGLRDVRNILAFYLDLTSTYTFILLRIILLLITEWHVDDFYIFLYLCCTSIKKVTNKQHR